jgi:hypothetical protein
MARFVNLSGVQHEGQLTGDISETTGPSFDPSGTRFYFSSQRAGIAGATYEVTGPWRNRPDATIRPKPQEVRGLPVTVTLATRSSIALELRARNAKGRRVVVARAARNDVRPKPVRFTLRPNRSVRNLKRLTLVATVTETVGRSAKAKQRIRLRGE